jgi:hypothetical protein
LADAYSALAKGQTMDSSVQRYAGIAGLVAVGSMLTNLIFTTDGPRPDLPAKTEAARAVSEAGALRASALLIVLMALAIGAVFVLLGELAKTDSAARRARLSLLRASVAAATGVWLVSAAVLAVVPQVAGSGLSPDLVTALGDVHSTLFFANSALLGATFVLAGWATDGVLPTWSRWIAVGVGACGIIASPTMGIRDFDLGHGIPVLFVLPFFLGLPLWLLSTSVALLLGGRTVSVEGSIAL